MSEPNGKWFERYVIEALGRIETKVDAHAKEADQRDLVVENRLTSVEARASRSGAIAGGLAAMVPVAILLVERFFG